MSVLIKDMEMPERCADCWLMDGDEMWCVACYGWCLDPEYRHGIKDKPDWCPLEEVPTYVAEIESEYKKWVSMPHINKPLAKALYEVWKKHDREDVSRNG